MTPDYFPHRSPIRLRASRFVAVATACAVAIASVSARAEKQGGGLPVIRDAEVEQLLRDYSAPVIRAAGLGQRNIHVVIINDRSFNAFVVDAKRIFVNAGALIGAQGVIQRSLLAYQRQQEEQADRAGVNFLNMTGQSAKGMYETFKRFADQGLFASTRADPYLQSHPMPTERLAALAEVARTSPNWEKKDPAELQARHDLMRAKLFGYMERPDTLQRRYPAADTSLAARYARAVSTYRHADLRIALGQMDALIQAQPNNPYFYELKGQALVEAGHAQDAIPLLRRAISLAPDPTLIRVMLGQALVETNDPRLLDEAVATLRHAVASDPDIADAYDQLAMAYGRKNNLADADLASAQAAFNRGNFSTARQLAGRAKGRFPVGSPGWVKADDIASFRPPQRGLLQ